MKQYSVLYNFGFSAAVCGVCAILVSSAAVTLRPLQERNEKLEIQINVLAAAGMIEAGKKPSVAEVDQMFERIKPVVIDLQSGVEAPDIDPATFDQQRAKKDPATSREAPKNRSRVLRLPLHALIYQVIGEDGQVEKLVLPIEGYGLWGTLYGFIALADDTTTVEGLTYYAHIETPGLGAEVDNPRWKALWVGRKAYDENWQPKLTVIKGRAGPAAEDPYRVDGLSGATLTTNGVREMLVVWLGPDGFAPYLKKFRQERSAV